MAMDIHCKFSLIFMQHFFLLQYFVSVYSAIGHFECEKVMKKRNYNSKLCDAMRMKKKKSNSK